MSCERTILLNLKRAIRVLRRPDLEGACSPRVSTPWLGNRGNLQRVIGSMKDSWS